MLIYVPMCLCDCMRCNTNRNKYYSCEYRWNGSTVLAQSSPFWNRNTKNYMFSQGRLISLAGRHTEWIHYFFLNGSICIVLDPTWSLCTNSGRMGQFITEELTWKGIGQWNAAVCVSYFFMAHFANALI